MCFFGTSLEKEKKKSSVRETTPKTNHLFAQYLLQSRGNKTTDDVLDSKPTFQTSVPGEICYIDCKRCLFWFFFTNGRLFARSLLKENQATTALGQ